MKVSEVMEKDVRSCGPDDTLESTAMMIWNNNCGSAPVIDSSGTRNIQGSDKT